MAKKINGFIKLQVPAGKANPSPPIGPALGQRGLNIMEFCKAFNAQTQGMEPGLMLPVVITAFADKSFTFILKTPPATVLIKKALKLDKGSGRPHLEKVGKLTRAQIEEIAKTKQKDLTAADLDAAALIRITGRISDIDQALTGPGFAHQGDLDAARVTFKYGLGDEFIGVLRTLHTLGLDGTDPVLVKGEPVSPRDVVASVLPDPATIGPRMTGKTCAGVWVTGLGLDGQAREVYLYHVADNEVTMREFGAQCVVWQTAINPIVALELLPTGVWSGAGVYGPEAFDAVPYLELLAAPAPQGFGSAWGLREG